MSSIMNQIMTPTNQFQMPTLIKYLTIKYQLISTNQGNSARVSDIYSDDNLRNDSVSIDHFRDNIVHLHHQLHCISSDLEMTLFNKSVILRGDTFTCMHDDILSSKFIQNYQQLFSYVVRIFQHLRVWQVNATILQGRALITKRMMLIANTF